MQIEWGFKITIELTVRQKQCILMSIHTLSLLLPLAPVAFQLLFLGGRNYERPEIPFVSYKQSDALAEEASHGPCALLGHTPMGLFFALLPRGNAVPPGSRLSSFLLSPCLFHNSLFFLRLLPHLSEALFSPETGPVPLRHQKQTCGCGGA